MVRLTYDKKRIAALAVPSLRCSTQKFVRDEDRPKKLVKCTCKGIPPSDSERIWELAVPLKRNTTAKYVRPEPRNVECTCKVNFKTPARTTMLALPNVRTLLLSKSECRREDDSDRKKNIDVNIRRSLGTIYTRLAGYEMPPKKVKSKKWDEEDWIRHTKRLSALAKPRRCFSEQTVEKRPSKPIDNLYVDYLSMPRHPVRPYEKPHMKASDPIIPVSQAALLYEATPEIQRLAKPKAEFTDVEPIAMYENPFNPPLALRGIQSVGLKVLATPNHITQRNVKGDHSMMVFGVSAGARKANASERTKTLANPIRRGDNSTKKNAFGVKPAALKELKGEKLEYYKKLSEPVKRRK